MQLHATTQIVLLVAWLLKVRNPLCRTHKRPIVRTKWSSCLFRLYWVRSASLVVLLLAGGLGWLWLCWCVWSQSQDYPNGDPPSLFSSRSAGSTAGLSAAALIKRQQMDQASSAGSDGHQVHKTWGKVHHKVHKVLCGLPIPQYKQTFRHSSCEFNGLFWV